MYVIMDFNNNIKVISLFFRVGRVIGILILRLLRYFFVLGAYWFRDNVNVRVLILRLLMSGLFLCLGSGIPFSQGFFIRGVSRE